MAHGGGLRFIGCFNFIFNVFVYCTFYRAESRACANNKSKIRVRSIG